MADNHHVIARWNEKGYYVVKEILYQYDYGQVLTLEDFDLPEAFEVHFSGPQDAGRSVTQIGHTVDGVSEVDIPDACLLKSRTITAWLYLHDTENDGETRFVIEMHVCGRGLITGDVPTPVEKSTVSQAITALNRAVEETATAQEAAETAQAAAEAAQALAEASATAAAGSAGAAAQSAIEADLSADLAETAQGAAETAKGAAEIAKSDAEAAQTAAEEARSAAQSAAGESGRSASAAAQSANQADQSARSAAGSASAAADSASAAQMDATAAGQHADDAEAAKTAAAGSATQAAGSADDAAGSAGAAAASAGQAAQSATAAAGSATDAAGSAAAAAQTVAGIESAGAAQVALVEAKGQEVLDSIPADYSDLTEEVRDLNSALESAPTEEAGQELLALEVINGGLMDTALRVIGMTFENLPQDDAAVDVANSIALECERLELIYNGWMAEREGA